MRGWVDGKGGGLPEMTKFHTRTLKLKLRVVSGNLDESWGRIRQISNDAWRAANWIASGQYLNDQIMRRIYARRKIDPKNDLSGVQAVEKEFELLCGTKRQATTERDLKEAFPNLPPCVTNPLNQVVYASYKKEKGDLLTGTRSLRTYRKGMAIQTTKASWELSAEENGNHCLRWKLSRSEAIHFEIFYGRDKVNHRLTVSRILDGENVFSAPQIQLKEKDLFLLLPVKEPQQELSLIPEISVGVHFGSAVPVYVALSDGDARWGIGSKEDILRVRIQMQNRQKNLQRGLKFVRGGKGRRKKLRGLNRVKEKATNFAQAYNHNLSRQVVDFAVKNRAGLIKMEIMEGFEQKERDLFVLQSWPFFELQTMIEYKAKRMGIEVTKVDPDRSTQTCSVCGYCEGERRQDRMFRCKGCGAELGADHNAALNIARSRRFITSKEHSEIYKPNDDVRVDDGTPQNHKPPEINADERIRPLSTR